MASIADSDSTPGAVCGLNVLVMFFSAIRTQDVLPSLLRRAGVVHELRAPLGTAAHIGLAAQILAAQPADMPVLWLSTTPDWYPPGLAWAGVDPSRCLFAAAKDDAEALAGAETGLRGGMAAVVVCEGLTRLASKRLALAAKQGHAAGLVLRHAPAQTAQDSTAFASRWLVSPVPGGRRRAELLYAKGMAPGVYMFPLEEENDRAPLALLGLHRTG